MRKCFGVPWCAALLLVTDVLCFSSSLECDTDPSRTDCIVKADADASVSSAMLQVKSQPTRCVGLDCSEFADKIPPRPVGPSQVSRSHGGPIGSAPLPAGAQSALAQQPAGAQTAVAPPSPDMQMFMAQQSAGAQIDYAPPPPGAQSLLAQQPAGYYAPRPQGPPGATGLAQQSAGQPISPGARFDKTCWEAGFDLASRDAACQGALVCARYGYDNRLVGDCNDGHCCSVAPKERYDMTCYEAGTDITSRDASCKGDLVCARNGADNRQFGDCPTGHCCSLQLKERFDKSCYAAGEDLASRDAACKDTLVCARYGFDNRKFGDCPGEHCCSQPMNSKDRYDTTCWEAGPDMATRDASCKGELVCAKKGWDNRNFGDCPSGHCCSMPMFVKERYDTSCWEAGRDMATRDASCKEGLLCAKKGHDNRNFGDCPSGHCCSVPLYVKERYDTSCWAAGTDMASRDASCKKGLVCAKAGYDGRNFGDCPSGHCCSVQMGVKERYDTSCWAAGNTTAARDASCKEGLVCAKKGADNRNFGDCPQGHCCSVTLGVMERYDESCWAAGNDMASRDAACKPGLLCAKSGSDNRVFGDCPQGHCCSLAIGVKERYDTTCWEVGTDMASRDASCKQGLVCAKKGYDNRNFGDCPSGHCCSVARGTLERYDTSCWAAGADMASRDASCKKGLVCAKKGYDNRNFGDCPSGHCCSMPLYAKERYDTSCWAAGTDMASRDASCKKGLVCAKAGYDGRNFGDCLSGHCCSVAMGVKERYDSSCWAAGNDTATRDASCKQGLVCAQKGYDNRNFGDCPSKHCCSVKAGALERYDTSCWAAGNDMASRDAACKTGLVCAKYGFDDRKYGDCPSAHCCSVALGTLDRYDASCWAAGTDMASRDASCRAGFVCSKKGYDGRDFGDCPSKHCCSMMVGMKERYDTTCWAAGNDMGTRDASCKKGLVCAKKGFDNRNFGDCPQGHCCSVTLGVLERYDESCWLAGTDAASRDAACKPGLLCAKKGNGGRNFGDCDSGHCCSLQVGVLERLDDTCWLAGTDMVSRDASCKKGLVCAQKGYDNRNFGDCQGKHCCSVAIGTKERYDASCWLAGPDMASRDASCQTGLVCAKKGYDNRNVGDCPDKHCCSIETGVKERYDPTCWTAGTDMASRDASCKQGLVCAKKGYDGRNIGDCPDKHCCSVAAGGLRKQGEDCFPSGVDMASRDAACEGDLVCARQGYDGRNAGDCTGKHCCSIIGKERYADCWQAGMDLAARDASCKGSLVCARQGFDGRESGDCPGKHCCSQLIVAGQAIYAVGDNNLVYKQELTRMSPSSSWSVAGKGIMTSITISGSSIYGVGRDNKVYMQELSSMTPSSNWVAAAPGPGNVIWIAIDGNTMYGAGADKKIYARTINPPSGWRWAGKGAVTSIAIKGDDLYGIGTDQKVYKQKLSTLSTGSWSAGGAGIAKSVAINGDTIYITSRDDKVYSQALSTMTPSSHWTLAGPGKVLSVAVTPGADPSR